VHIAARVKADMFVSVHANSSPSEEARGVETYVYGQRNTSGHINDVVRRENADSNYLDIMLNDLAQLQFHDRSVEMAGSVERQLVQQLGVTGRAHRKIMQAPFYVLARAERPAILVEVGFISNPREERLLGSPDWRRQIAESIAAGLITTFGAS
jgi:N-acetylmuramoyl-L-alanine amidase